MELSVDQALQKGIEAHRAGKIQEAYGYYNAILKADPLHCDANHNMGVLAVSHGKFSQALTYFRAALSINPEVEQYWLSFIGILIKLDQITDAKAALILSEIQGKEGDGFDRLRDKVLQFQSTHSTIIAPLDPTQKQVQNLLVLYQNRQFKELLAQSFALLLEFPHSLILHNLRGAAYKGLGQFNEAISIYKKALSIKHDNADLYNNLGVAFKDSGQFKNAIQAFNDALSIRPNFPEAYNNIGITLGNEGKSHEAIEAFKKAISLQKNYASAYNNMGVAFKDIGQTGQAIKAFETAISLQAGFVNAHHNLSLVKKYTAEDQQLAQVTRLIDRKEVTVDEKCKLSFTLAKIYEDTGKIESAYKYFIQGNALRKQLLKYSIEQDRQLFTNLRIAQKYLFNNTLNSTLARKGPIPIFILGMPRSGTTLIEQIVSAHSAVTGAGELIFVKKFGSGLINNMKNINLENIQEFREKYLHALESLSDGKAFVTDKMPLNFRFIPLICAALPEAKIIHVERDAAATCWSNFKHYFSNSGLGYSYDLNDVVSYYRMYQSLMESWMSNYKNKIFKISYEELTEKQIYVSKKMLQYLELNWEEGCLSPHENNRIVRTASHGQVRREIYQGSSEHWIKYKPFLNGIFDCL